MGILENIASVKGMRDKTSRSLVSNSVIVSLPDDELTIVKGADKTSWESGCLTFTITINNDSSTSYDNLVLSDFVNPALMVIIKESIKINEIPISSSEYINEDGTLKININNITPNSQTVIKFSVKRLKSCFFKFCNIASLNSDNVDIKSNRVAITALSTRCKQRKNCCDKPYLGTN